MAEYIKRGSAMTVCERHRQHCFEANDSYGLDIADRIFDDISNLPTADVVPVVRCKDCKYHHKEKGGWCELHDFEFESNDYCCDGERWCSDEKTERVPRESFSGK